MKRPKKQPENSKFLVAGSTHNYWLDTAAIARKRRPAVPKATRDWNEGIVNVKNTTGVDVPRYGVMQLWDPLYPELIAAVANPTFHASQSWKCVKPGSLLDGWRRDQIVIAQRPMKNNATGEGMFMGVTNAHVSITHTWHRFCETTTNDVTDLKTCLRPTSVELLWIGDVQAGKAWCKVRIGRRPTQNIYHGVASGTIPPNGSGTVTLTLGGDTENITSVQHDVAHGGSAINSGDEVFIYYDYHDDVWRVIVAECPLPP